MTAAGGVRGPARLAALAAAVACAACAGAPARPPPAPALAADAGAPAAPAPASPLEPPQWPEAGPPAPPDDAAAEADAEPAELAALREAVVAAAAARAGRPFRGDCSGYVLAALRDAGVRPRLGPGRSRTEALHRASAPVEAPRPGDLVFFHDTYDRNRDGRRNDRFTHVALVESVDGSAVTFLHRGRRGVERARMDLARPGDPGVNDPIRIRRRGEKASVPTLAGELFTSFGGLLPGEFTQMLQGGRGSAPGTRHPAPR